MRPTAAARLLRLPVVLGAGRHLRLGVVLEIGREARPARQGVLEFVAFQPRAHTRMYDAFQGPHLRIEGRIDEGPGQMDCAYLGLVSP